MIFVIKYPMGNIGVVLMPLISRLVGSHFNTSGFDAYENITILLRIPVFIFLY